LLRGVFVAALFSAFGVSLFAQLVAPQALKLMGAPDADAIEGRCFLLARVSLLAALALLGWLPLETSDMSDAANATDVLAAIPEVLLGTSFGHDLIAQALAVFAALLLLTAWAQRGRFATVGLTGLALALQAGHSHAFAMEHGPSLLLYAEGLHLLAGGAWLGGLLPLLILVRDAPPKPAAEALRRFSKLATLCVLAIAGTACFQGWVLGGGVAGLIGTALWLGASPQGGALCPPARACGHQPLSPHSGAGAPRRTAGKRSAHAHHSSGDRAWADGGACRRRAERP
jgi:putative copper resistance protein D